MPQAHVPSGLIFAMTAAPSARVSVVLPSTSGELSLFVWSAAYRDPSGAPETFEPRPFHPVLLLTAIAHSHV